MLIFVTKNFYFWPSKPLFYLLDILFAVLLPKNKKPSVNIAIVVSLTESICIQKVMSYLQDNTTAIVPLFYLFLSK